MLNGPTVPEGHEHRVTTPETLGKPRLPPQNPAETPQSPRRDPAEPSQRPAQSPLRGKFPRRALRRVVPPRMVTLRNFKRWDLSHLPKNLVSHYSAIGDTISCDAPYSAMGFRGKLFLRYPPFLACLLTAIGHLQGKKWGCSSDSLRYHRKHSATGVLLHLSRDRGGISVGSLSLRRAIHGPTPPKGPLRNKNSTVLESVVFCYGCRFTFCTVFLLLAPRKRSISEPSP